MNYSENLIHFFPHENDENKVKEAFEIISFLEENAESLDMIDKSKYVGRIASKLYSIDVSTIKSLPKSVFYSIIKNDELALENEDMLLDLIDAFFSEGETEPEEVGGQSLCKIDFYEEVNFDFLRKDKFKEFIKKIEMNEMTTTLCNNLKKGFFAYKKSTSKIRLFEYNDKKEYAFKGIIHKLTEKC